MKTFTVRDLDRSPGKVLAAAERDGEARVRRRDGGVFAVKPVTPAAKSAPDWKAFVRHRRAWLKKTFPEPVAWTKEQVDEINRAIAGDGPLL